MILPDFLHSIFIANFAPVKSAEAVQGGDINQSAKVTTESDDTYFVKWHLEAPPDMFTSEAHGLRTLTMANALRIPHCFYQDEQCLILNWLGNGAHRTPNIGILLGEGLVQQHQFKEDQYGLDRNNYCGLTPQINTWHDSWIDFFMTCRLIPQISLAEQNNRLSTRRSRGLENLLKHLPNFLPTHPPSSLLHGDLWGGNWLVAPDGQPALIDPAVYYGHREADLAFTELFGGFPPEFYQAYQTSWPLEPGYAERKEIYNLYHLLNHLNLFGEGYGPNVDRIIQQFS